jgi:hypothetical protein
VLFYWPLGAALIISFLLALVTIPWLSLTGRARLSSSEDESESGSNAAGNQVSWK